MELTNYPDAKSIEKDLKKIKSLSRVFFSGYPLRDQYIDKLVYTAYEYIEKKNIDMEVLNYEESEPEIEDDVISICYDPKKKHLILELSVSEYTPAVTYGAEVGGTNEEFELSPREFVDSHSVWVRFDPKGNVKGHEFKESRNCAFLE